MWMQISPQQRYAATFMVLRKLADIHNPDLATARASLRSMVYDTVVIDTAVLALDRVAVRRGYKNWELFEADPKNSSAEISLAICEAAEGFQKPEADAVDQTVDKA